MGEYINTCSYKKYVLIETYHVDTLTDSFFLFVRQTYHELNGVRLCDHNFDCLELRDI